MIKINYELKSPIEWDIIDDFSFNDPNSIIQLKKNNCIIKGPNCLKKASRIDEHVSFAKTLNLFSNVVHSYSIPGIKVLYNLH